MQLIDSNILIYSAKPEFLNLRNLLIIKNNAVSIISKLEVLGYHRLTQTDSIYFDAVFKTLYTFPIDNPTINKAIELRSNYNLSVGDSIIAATALLNNIELVTRNVADFKKITDLKIINSF